jgi:sugar lactone lactonase YvrE
METASTFSSPAGIAIDPSGNLFVADSGNNTIRRISPGGLVTTLAGLAAKSGSVDGVGAGARFNVPRGVAVDSAGNTYVADADNATIRRVTPAGSVTTLAGSPGESGSSDGTGSAARFGSQFPASPSFVAVDNDGNLYAADTQNGTIRKVTPGGLVTTLAGSPGQSGCVDGTGSAAEFVWPLGIALDETANVYVADGYCNTIRVITPDGNVTTLAGNPMNMGSTDGSGGTASFSFPSGVAVDADGSLYVADTDNATIRKITSDGVVTTLAGSAGLPGNADGEGSAARFSAPAAVAVDASGNVYVADVGNHVIRKITPGGMVTTVVGATGVIGTNPGPLPAVLSYPQSVAVAPGGDLVFTDENAVLVVHW